MAGLRLSSKQLNGRRSDMAGSSNKTLWTKDTIAGVILGCVACLFVQAQLQAVAAKVNSPVLNEVLPWWPAVLIVAGLVLLFSRKAYAPKDGTSRQLGGSK
jgi:hypothetical protein